MTLQSGLISAGVLISPYPNQEGNKLMFLSEWREYPVPCLVGKKGLMTARVSMLLKSCTSLTCFRACFLPGRAKVTTMHCGLNIAQDIILHQLNQIPFVSNCIPLLNTTECCLVSNHCAHPCEQHPPQQLWSLSSWTWWGQSETFC